MDNSSKRKAPGDDDLETEPFLKRHKEEKETVEGLEEAPPDFVVEGAAAVRRKTIVVGYEDDHVFRRSGLISDIIDFFKNVGQVVRVRIMLTFEGKHAGWAFVEFASADEADKALEKNSGKCGEVILKKGDAYLPPKYCIDHKVWFYDEEEENECLVEQESSSFQIDQVLLVANISPQTTKISDIVDFFRCVARVVCVRLIVDREGKHVGYCFVEFDSADEANKALEEKNREYLHDHEIFLMRGPFYSTILMSSVEAARNKTTTLYVAPLSRQTEISDIVDFFKDVGQVVRVRFFEHAGYCFVEFSSPKEAYKALEKKKGEVLHDHKIYLEPIKTGRRHPLDCKDYIRLLKDVEEVDETEIAVRDKTVVFVANLSLTIRKSDIINFFKDVGKVASVRLIVDRKGECVGCGFVEFASKEEATEAVQEKNGANIFVSVAEIARQYPFRPKNNLQDKLWWYEYNLLARKPRSGDQI